MPSLWLEEEGGGGKGREGEQFHHDQTNNHAPYVNETQNPIGGVESPALSGSRTHPQTMTSSAQPLGTASFETYSPYTYHWAANSTPTSQDRMHPTPTMPASQYQSESQNQYQTQSQHQHQYPDDIDRSRWTETQPANDLSYSPSFSDSPVISSAARPQTTRFSDIDSLFEGSDELEDEDEMLMPGGSRDEREEDEGVVHAIPYPDHDHDHDEDQGNGHGQAQDQDHDQHSPYELSRQLHGQLNVLSSDPGVAPEEEDMYGRVHGQQGYDMRLAQHEYDSPHPIYETRPCSNANESGFQNLSIQDGDGEIPEQRPESETRHAKVHDCACGCSTKACACHPSYCECLGCDHTEQTRQLRSEAERKWGCEGHSTTQSCGCGDGQRRCSCIPGLCHCGTCSEHGRLTGEPVMHCGCGRNGQKCRCAPERCACPDCAEHHAAGGEDGEDITEPEGYQKPAREIQSVDDDMLSPQTRVRRQIDEFLGDRHEEIMDADDTHTCRCTHEGTCSCPPGRYGCGKESSTFWGRERGSQRHVPTRSYLCRDGKDYNTCSLAGCRCRQEEGAAPDLEALRRETQPAGLRRALTWEARQDHRPLHLKLAELIESPIPVPPPPGSAPIFSRKASALPTPLQPPTPAFSQQSPITPSRPDTPRPRAESTPSTPYAADVLQDYVQQSIEPGLLPPTREHIRQSVEPELPPPNWARESTPAYVDRSSTPSPKSPFPRGDTDVEMRDASPTLLPGDIGREMSLPPPTSQPCPSMSGDHLAVSPVKPVPPPIPDGEFSIKQPKRGERRKSAVHGSKIEKRSATGTTAKPKSRNVTRKPTASVGKLVDKAKKKTKQAAAEAAEGGEGQGREGAGRVSSAATATAASHAGKVAAAVEKIERQVKQQEEEKHLKQKDGTAVRRSRRANKGVRTSLGYT